MPYTPGNDRLVVLGQAILTAANLTLRAARRPGRQFLAPGPRSSTGPAMDCAQLAVYFSGSGGNVTETSLGNRPMTQTMPSKGDRPGGRILPYRAQLVIECAPGMKDKQAPDPAVLTAFATEAWTDGYDLWRGLIVAAKDGTLLGAEGGGCCGVRVGSLVPGGPQGTVVYWNVDVIVEDC